MSAPRTSARGACTPSWSGCWRRVSFDAADRNGTRVVVDREYVEGNLGELVKDQDLSRYIL